MRSTTAGLGLLALLSGCGTDERVLTEGAIPSQPVEVVMDDNGVPHVYGATDRDAFYGAGYMIASHRLLQIELARRRAYGRSAEVFGVERLGDDELARLIDWSGHGARAAERTKAGNPEEWGIMTAWVAGVNRRIDEVRSGAVPAPFGFAELGLEPEPWEAKDVLVMAKMVGFGNDLSLEFEIFVTLAEKLLPALVPKVPLSLPAHPVFGVPPEDMPEVGGSGAAPDQPAPAVPRARLEQTPRASRLWRSLCSLRVGGSNNFAVDGRFTDNGRPKLAGDPHLPFGFPGLFYALHINSKDRGGSFDVAGFSFPFLPGVSIGHTDALAWSPTTAFADVMDVWEVPMPDDSTVVIGGEAIALRVREESIGLRDPGQPVGSGDPVVIEVRDVPGFGVILPNDIAPLPVAAPGKALLLRWTGYDDRGASRLLGLNRARSIDELDAAVDLQTGLNFNMLAADAKGITYRVGVEVPVRDPAKHPPWKVMDGSDPSALWTDAVLPRSQLPRGRAATRGWLATANNDPFGFTANGRVDDDPWYYGALFDPGWRAKRLSDELTRLTKQGNVSLADLQALQLDTRENLADDLLPLLEQAFAAAATNAELEKYHDDPRLVTLMDVLAKWDRRSTRDSPGAVVFTAFAHFVMATALQDDLSLLYGAVLDLEKIVLLKLALQALRDDFPIAASVLQPSRDAVLLTALLRTATEFLEPRFGSVDPSGYSYGDLHVSVFEDALGAGFEWGEHPSDGGETSVNVAPHSWANGATLAPRWRSSMGPILRLAVEFDAGGRPRMQFNAPLGNIADPSSPHSKDLSESWVEGTYRDMRFTRADVDAHVESRLELR